LARRRFRSARPFLVAMRARKPWVRLRRRLLGWNVRFMAILNLFGCHEGGNSRQVNLGCQRELPANLSRVFRGLYVNKGINSFIDYISYIGALFLLISL